MDMKTRLRKSTDRIAGAAAVVIIVCICFMMDAWLGVGAIVGSLAVFIAWSFLKDHGSGAEQAGEDYSFLDTAVLRENFSIPQNLPIPYAVLDIRGRLMMHNERFSEIFEQPQQARPIIEQLMKKSGQGEVVPVEYNGRHFDAALDHCDVEEENGAVGVVLTLTLVDTSECYDLMQKLDSSETVVGMLLLDNYEEVVDSISEDRLPILSAMVDRRLTQLAVDTSGVIKKLEKDRYIFLLSKGNLEKLKERKFDIMNQLREISVGEHIPVTMSMGLGVSGGSLEESMQSAKAALDLALGRGGDQVLVKEGEKYLFYGAKAGEVGRNSRTRARVKADALWELMDGASGILVMGHRNADLDSLGACMGICAISRAMDKKCHILLNEVSAGIRALYETMAENCHYETNFLKDADALRIMDEKTLVIVVDTHRSSMVESPQVLAAAKQIVVFDHHRKSTDFIDQAVLTYHEPYASSAAELVTEIIQHIGKKVKLKPIEADALLAGITVDTKNFAVKTGAITFDAAGFLRRNGADSIRVRRLFQNDMDSYKAKAAAVHDAELFHGNMAISFCPAEGKNASLVAAQAADDLMNVTGVQASFVYTKVGEVIFISARSFGDVNVQRIMEKLGGGGHYTVSGAQLKGCTIQEAKEKICRAIEEYTEEEQV